MAELIQPSDGSMVEFWCHRMSQQGKAGTGIRGWFRDGLFWSHDNADHYAPGEVAHWMMRQGEGRANARLIAAAPDMLNALRSLLRHAERMQEVMDDECGIRFRDDGPMAMARDALRLAVGDA